MQALRTRPTSRRGGIVWLSTSQISPSPVQPRKQFDPEALEELSRSIKYYGILNPLTVRCRGKSYELVAGERRLRAAKLAGLREVPCILLDVNMEDASLIALIENLQRRDLDFIEEAMGLNQLIRTFGLSQEEAARRIGKSQSAVANKLRLLRLSGECAALLCEHDLSERHARALLRLADETERLAALKTIIARGMNVAQTEEYVEALLKKSAVTPPPRKPAYIIKDVRIFLNSVHRQLGIMQRAGVAANAEREDTDDEIRLVIRIPRGKNVSKM